MLFARRILLGPFAFLAVAGLACAPVARVDGSFGGQGGQGTGGDPGVGGASSTSSAAQTSTSASNSATGSSSSGMCGPTEGCFNGIDDDCNGLTDCEDPACGGVAVCEPQVVGAPNGVLVPKGSPCPGGYLAGEQIINRKLIDDGCVGCSCGLKAVICTGDVWYYSTAAACTNDTFSTGGTAAGSFGTACDGNAPISSGMTFGARTSAWKTTQSCIPGGSASPAAVDWAETMKFCAASKEGKGCPAGNTCVPNVAAAPHCALAAGKASCGAFATTESDWYTGFTDTRTCGACGCNVTGASCSPMHLDVGSDYTCGTSAVVPEKTKKCFPGNGIYAPPVGLGGAPISGTCTGNAKVGGSLDGTGQMTLCCQP